jgi:hypothetical protein
MAKMAVPDSARVQAEEIRKRQAAEAQRETEKSRKAFDEKTARLRGLRLAKEAADREAAAAAATEKAAAAAATKRTTAATRQKAARG